MNHTDERERQRNWTAFWQHGALHSLSDAQAGNYEGAVAAFWHRVFGGLGTGQHVLDIATGNGPLPAMLHAMHAGALPLIDAVDLADPLQPAWHQMLPASERERIRFHPGVRAETLPFADAGHDLVTSQYGIEYADLDLALGEALRVLKPGGRMALVMHHADSQLVTVAREELRLSALLRAPDAGLLARARALYPWLAKVAAGARDEVVKSPQAAAARLAYNEVQSRLSAECAASPVPDLLHDAREVVASHVDGLMRGAADATQAIAALDDWEQALGDAEFRHRELLSHALDQHGIDKVTAKLSAAGACDIHVHALDQDGMLLGWALECVKT